MSTWRYWRRWRPWIILSAAASIGPAVGLTCAVWWGGPTAVAVGVAVAAVTAAVTGPTVDRMKTHILDRNKAHLVAAGGLLGAKRPRAGDIADPLRLGVHPAALSPSGSRVPDYVRRDVHSQVAEALRSSKFVIVVGESASGKTRLLYEAMREELPDRRVFVPIAPGKIAESAVSARETPESVLWLDDIERYLSAGLDVGLLLTLTESENCVVLATMRTQEHLRYLRVQEAAIDEARRDLWRAGREVVERAYEIDLGRRWTPSEIERAERSSDERVREAARHSDRFGVAESLAAGPELVKTLRDARVPGGHPSAAAIVVAAVDGRRAGLQEPISASLLNAVHGYYLAEWGGSDLRSEGFEQGIEFATRPIYGVTCMLLADGDGGYMPHDYLVDNSPGGEIPEAVFARYLDQASAPGAYEMGKVAFSTWRLDRAEKAFRPAAAAGHWHATYLLAASVRESGRPREAVGLLQDLLASHAWTAADSADKLTTRAALARCLADSGEVQKAIALYGQLVADDQRQGLDPADALAIRHDQAYWLAASGRITEALVLLREVYEERLRILGPDHPDTLTTRHNIARWTGEGGDPAAAITSFRALLSDRLRVLGPDHPSTLGTRAQLALWLDRTGNHEEALATLQTLLADRIRVLGAAHPKTLMTRELIGRAHGAGGDAPRAVAELQDVLADRMRIMGEGHPATLVNRNQLARWLRIAGHAADAIAVLAPLVDDDTRTFGSTHPATLNARHNLALAQEASGDAVGALATITDLSRDLASVNKQDGGLSDRVEADRSRIAGSIATADLPDVSSSS